MWLKVFIVLTIANAIAPQKLEPFELDEFLQGTFYDKGWNGSWISDSSVLYENNLRDYYIFDVNQKTSTLFLRRSVFNGYPRSAISFTSNLKYGLIKYNRKRMFDFSDTAQYAVYDVQNGRFYDLHNRKTLRLVQWSPKDGALAYVYENNIYYVSNVNQISTPRQITNDGVDGVIFNGVPDWLYEELILRSASALWFSPDGSYLAFIQYNDTMVKDIHYFIYGESNNQYPTLVTLKYPKVNTPNPLVSAKYIDLRNSGSNVLTLNQAIPTNIVSQDHILQEIKWANNTDIVAVSFNRIQNVAAIVRCNIRIRKCRNIYTERTSKGWITLRAPVFNNDGSQSLMITSESEGNDFFHHLSLLENNNFANRIRLTYGKRIVNFVYAWDEVRNLVYYVGSVRDHYEQQQVYVVDLNTNADRCLTCDFNTLEGPCVVSSVSFSKEFSHYEGTCNGPGPNTVRIFNVENLDYYEWESNNDLRIALSQKLRSVRKDIKVVLSSGFDAHVRLLLPPELDENADVKYPMIVDVYAGPNSHQIADNYYSDIEDYLVTNRKYIYAFIDARGTARQGNNYLFEIYKKLGTVEVADTIEVTRYLHDNYQFIDSDKTGIWGWSYGGFATLLALVQDTNNVFKFGLAVAPVTNFIHYGTAYAERYMGLNTIDDNMEGYNKTNVMQFVEAFRNKTLYIIHGNADDNVHYQHSMLLCKALEEADIMFFQHSYPDNNHDLGSVGPHMYHTMDKFFSHGFKTVREGNIWKSKKNKRQI